MLELNHFRVASLSFGVLGTSQFSFGRGEACSTRARALVGSAQKLDQPHTWMASNLVGLKHAPIAPSGVQLRRGNPLSMRLTPTLTVRAPTAMAHGQQCLSLFLHLTFLLHSMSWNEEACKLPPQRRVTSQVMRHWAQHKIIEGKAPSARCLTFKPSQR